MEECEAGYDGNRVDVDDVGDDEQLVGRIYISIISPPSPSTTVTHRSPPHTSNCDPHTLGALLAKRIARHRDKCRSHVRFSRVVA